MLGRYGAKLRTKNVLQTSFELRCLLVTCVKVAMIEPVFVLVAQTSFELHCLLVTCVQVAMIEPVFVLVAGLLWKCCWRKKLHVA